MVKFKHDHFTPLTSLWWDSEIQDSRVYYGRAGTT
ncbi:hypothetical protein [Sporisorium scitamineum]|uniref:Uncharacterized protein n=1 Tax=Sporisorium scitamineum TaxID=49012 RepID=A0A0F7RZE2_9BASI|nr:hypothetical protein [Sporisorium scitamineum]